MFGIEKILFGKAFLGLVKDPNQTENVFKMSAIAIKSRNQEAAKPMLEYALSQPTFCDLYERKYLPQKPDLNELARLAPGTLGNEFASHMKKYKLDVSFYPDLEPDSPLLYLILRLRQTHDIWHVLTGYDTSVADELALQGFSFAQTRSGIPAAIISAEIMHVLSKKPYAIGIYRGRNHGRVSKGKTSFVFSRDCLEEKWATPVTELRQLVG